MIKLGGCIHYGTFWAFAPVGILTQRLALVHLRGFKPAPAPSAFAPAGILTQRPALEGS